MCIGTPAQIVELNSEQPQLAKAAVAGVMREVDLTLVGSHDEHGQPRIGQWVLVHVGFAMSLIDEAEAQQTLSALAQMQELEPDVGDWLNLGGGGREIR